MSELAAAITSACAQVGNDRTRLIDILRTVQARFGVVSPQALDLIATQIGCRRVEVESCASFYAFLSTKPQGKVVIRLCNDVVDRMAGMEAIATTLEQELGIHFGQTTADGRFTLAYTPCIGLCDQAPAALINEVPVTKLTTDAVKRLVAELKKGTDPRKLVARTGDGNNASELVRSMVENNLRQTGPVVFAPMEQGVALKKAVAMSPQEVIRDVKASRLRGRGGAGFPAVICNADEGEPGTFKDRVILTEAADLLFEGMAIAGYAIGAQEGLVYLRGEYAYLQAFLEDVLRRRRAAGLLGKSLCGKAGFDFDIRIQMGAGAYICGEETSLISSCEGRRGDPKNRPPYPAQKGYLGRPTSVNNVETFCAAARILQQGAGWFAQLGSKQSPGTKVLSVSGDCLRPGVYEIEFGMPLSKLLTLVGADEAQAVLVGGPSGQFIGPDKFNRTICYDDLATGGAMVIFGRERDLLQAVEDYIDFFVEESCGYCTPCRVGCVLLKERLGRILHGKGVVADLDYLGNLGRTMKIASRCPLGQTAHNPVTTMLANLPAVFKNRVKEDHGGLAPGFDLGAATATCAKIAGHQSVHLH